MRLHPLAPASRERLRQSRIVSVNIFEKTNIAIFRDGSPVYDQHRNRRRQIDPQGLPACHCLANALMRPLRLVPQHPGREFCRLLNANAAMTEIAPGFCKQLDGGHGTSNVLAGRTWGIPIFGTLAHSYIQAHETETDAFEAFASRNPGTTLLVDTYDTLEGVRLVIALNGSIRAISPAWHGTPAECSMQPVSKTLRSLPPADWMNIRLPIWSQFGAPIDAFGVGTKLAVSVDAPEVDMAYKLVEYAGKGRFKLSRGKTTYPGRKQVFRQFRDSRMAGDTQRRHSAATQPRRIAPVSAAASGATAGSPAGFRRIRSALPGAVQRKPEGGSGESAESFSS